MRRICSAPWNRRPRPGAARAGTYPSWSRPPSPPWWREASGPAACWVATSRHRSPEGPSRSSACCPARRATLIKPLGCLPSRPASMAAPAWCRRSRPVRRCSAPTAAATWRSSRPGGRCRDGGRWPADSPASPTNLPANRAARISRSPARLVGGPQTNYLIGLAYPGGARIWVSATDEPNECVSASNGEFTSSGLIGPAVSEAFTSGRWPARPPVACNRPYQDIGRLGQDTAMVPAGSTSVTICAPKGRMRTLTIRLPGPSLRAQPAADSPLDPQLFRHARPFRVLPDFLLLLRGAAGPGLHPHRLSSGHRQ